MKTNNQQGRAIALVVGAYFIVKAVINLILGGGVMDVAVAAAEAVVLYTGLMYLNYIVAAVVVIVALIHLPANLGNIGDNWLYLLEGIIDIICAVVICVSPSVAEHFTNKWGGNSDK